MHEDWGGRGQGQKQISVAQQPTPFWQSHVCGEVANMGGFAFFSPSENGLFVILVLSETTAAIAPLRTDNQNPFRTPIKLLQSSGTGKTFPRKKHNNSFDSSTSQITSEALSKEQGQSRRWWDRKDNGKLALSGLLGVLFTTQLERAFLGATAIYFLINTGAAYENTLAVLVTPAGFVHLPGPQQAQGTPGCHVPAAGMLQRKGEGKGFLLGDKVPARGREYNIRNSTFVRTNFWLLGCCCYLYLLLAFPSFRCLHNFRC